ncbi:MAG: GGDEF domain-containing protein [Chloroflexi bacterium]|nr:GGDEF domain-containing protein [Chloroflexota bacterium]
MPVTPMAEFAAGVERAVDEHYHGAPSAAFAVTDLDGFDGVNTEYGHEAGDRVLAAWQRTLTGSLPREALVARVGGDAFAVALPGFSAESALIVLEEIRSHFAGHPPDGIDQPLDVSMGIAARPPHANAIADLARAAEDAMIRAKREGGGRIVIYVEEKMVLKSNYYSRAALDQLAKLSIRTGRTEASLLREALDDLIRKLDVR